MYYIFNKDGFCFCTCDYKPNLDDLASREEKLIQSNKIYDASKIKLENGVIIEISPAIEELKQAKLTELKTIRDTEEVKPIEYNGNLFDFDDKARDRINSAIIALSITGQSIEWTTADNTNVLVTADDLRGVVANVAVRSNAMHVKYRLLKEQVNTCANKEEIDAIQWN